MRPIVNVPKEDRATEIRNKHKNFGKDRACSSGGILAHRQTDTQTDILITVLRNRSRGRSNNKHETRTTTTVSRPLYRTIGVSRRPQFRISLEQSFTARMPLLTATSAFGIWRRRQSSLQRCYDNIKHNTRDMTKNKVFCQTNELYSTSTCFQHDQSVVAVASKTSAR